MDDVDARAREREKGGERGLRGLSLARACDVTRAMRSRGPRACQGSRWNDADDDYTRTQRTQRVPGRGHDARAEQQDRRDGEQQQRRAALARAAAEVAEEEVEEGR